MLSSLNTVHSLKEMHLHDFYDLLKKTTTTNVYYFCMFFQDVLARTGTF